MGQPFQRLFLRSFATMSATAAPFGLRPVYHPSGVIRQEALASGILSTYGTAIYTGTPIKYDTNGTIIVTATGADSAIGVFQGCEFSSAGHYFVLPYWPAAQTYDTPGPNNATNPMWAFFTSDPNIIYEGQSVGSVAAADVGESINVQTASGGSVYSGYSNQSLSAPTGSSAGTFQIVGIAPYEDNKAGDAFTIVRVKISTLQGPVA
jgi:hypothetical protein